MNKQFVAANVVCNLKNRPRQIHDLLSDGRLCFKAFSEVLAETFQFEFSEALNASSEWKLLQLENRQVNFPLVAMLPTNNLLMIA